jgi:hypothetical protein
MLLNTLLAFVGFLCLAQALVVPSNSGEGVHDFKVTQAGKDIRQILRFSTSDDVGSQCFHRA